MSLCGHISVSYLLESKINKMCWKAYDIIAIKSLNCTWSYYMYVCIILEQLKVILMIPTKFWWKSWIVRTIIRYWPMVFQIYRYLKFCFYVVKEKCDVYVNLEYCSESTTAQSNNYTFWGGTFCFVMLLLSLGLHTTSEMCNQKYDSRR